MKFSILSISSVADLSIFLLSSCDKSESTSTSNESLPSTETSEYPLKVCVVSGEELGSMGKPVVIDHEGTEIRFCCKSCLPDFKKDPEKFVAMVKSGTPPEGDHSGH